MAILKKPKIKHKLFAPIKEQLQMLLEYIDILEQTSKKQAARELMYLKATFLNTYHLCLLYLNDITSAKGKPHGRNYKL